MQAAEDGDVDALPRRGARFVGRTVIAGLGVAIIGSLALGAAETFAGAWVVASKLSGEQVPLGLLAAALGRAVLTHLLVWCPLMTVCALAVAVVRRRAAMPPEPFLWGAFVAVAGFVVAPVALTMMGRGGSLIHAGAYAGVAVLAIVTFAAATVIRRRLGMMRFGRARSLAAWVSALLTVGFGAALVRSPLFNPGGYQVSPPAAGRSASRGCNVLWIVLDTARADRMSCHGCPTPTTPFLDTWAKQAVVFDRAVSDGMWTLPSHASMFTGLSVRQHGAGYGHVWLDNEATTVAEVLRDNGYLTALFSNNRLVAPLTNLAQGFEVYHDMGRLALLGRFSLEMLCERWGVTPMVPWLDGDSGAALTNQFAAQWLDDRARDGRPFLMLINYMEAHLPYCVPKRYRRMYMDRRQVDRSYDLRRRAYGDVRGALEQRFNHQGGQFLALADREVLKRQYLATIRYLDDRVGETIEMFERRGLLDDTLVVITSDHGEYLDTHGMWGHQYGTYNDLAHVSLMIREPGRRDGLRIRAPVQHSDLYATVLNAALGRSDPGPGHDSWDLLAMPRVGEGSRVVICQFSGRDRAGDAPQHALHDPVLRHRLRPQIAAVDARMKYISSRDGQRELYDIAADPGETRNLFTSRPTEAERLARHLRAWRQAVPEYTPPDPEVVPDMSPEVRRALRAMGYLDGE
ncbi:MAG TPA: sulfatase-like hydrolase/transferase [Phycisphaerae bacterium]|nr:sulfatase-like hydrolase/transferase [Phycisphaerae bacterium]